MTASAMDSGRLLLVSGVVLLSISALLGFVQEQQRHSPDATGWMEFIAVGLAWSSWAFFLGPLARAMDRPRMSRWINIAGAIAALPTYVLLPALVVF